MNKTTYFFKNNVLNLGGKLVDLSTPKVMGILNVTPDSFFDGGKYVTVNHALKQAEKMVTEGADIIDIGGMSSKPGAEILNEQEELKRVMPVLSAVKKVFPSVPISIDTVYGNVAREAVNEGAVLINDISAGRIDASIIDVAMQLKIPYILMHMQGVSATMQQQPMYADVVKEVFEFLITNARKLSEHGVNDILIDPGFGFGKSLEHNYTLAKNLPVFEQIGLPIVVGISRKSMICKVLKVNPDKALNGSSALHALLVVKGANILRVHDVKEAKEVIAIALHTLY